MYKNTLANWPKMSFPCPSQLTQYKYKLFLGISEIMVNFFRLRLVVSLFLLLIVYIDMMNILIGPAVASDFIMSLSIHCFARAFAYHKLYSVHRIYVMESEFTSVLCRSCWIICMNVSKLSVIDSSSQTDLYRICGNGGDSWQQQMLLLCLLEWE